MRIPHLKIIIFATVIILLLVVLSGSGCISFTKPETTESTTTTTTTTTNNTPVITTNSTVWTPPFASDSNARQLPDIADVIAEVKPAVVAINTEVITYDFFNRPYTQKGAGSGLVIDANGIIVTNNHVVEGAKTVSVTMDDGTTYTADTSAIFTDAFSDLAIIKLNARNLPSLKLGDSIKMRIGDWVIAIGNSLGQGIRATEGIISQQNVSLQIQQGESLNNLIETSAAINAGNSGGPLVNLSGEVIGITSAKVSSVGVEGMGYAISSNTAAPIIQELVNKGYITRPWIGLSVYTIDQLVVFQLNLKISNGVVVVQVMPDSPADKAGLKEGDVIVSMGGKEAVTVDQYYQVLHNAAIGEPLTIIYWRGRNQNTVTVTPVESPKPTD